MSGERSKRQAVVAASIAALGFALVTAIAWPGRMNPDSAGQLAQARSGQLDAIHPPIMALLWRGLDRLIPGPGGMVLLQGALLWSGLALLTVLAVRRTRLGWATPIVGVWPPVLWMSLYVWKDSQMAGAGVLAVALLAASRDLDRPGLAAWALVPLLYATAVRHNALTATAPLLVVAVWLIARKLRVRRPRVVIAIGLASCVATGALCAELTHVLSGGHGPAPLSENFVHDLAAISKATGENLFPPSFFARSPQMTEVRLRELYLPETVHQIIWEPGMVGLIHEPDVLHDLRAAWRHAVVAHPLIWLRHRARFAASLLGLPGFTNQWFSTPWIYLGFILAFARWLWKRRRLDALTGALALGALLYVAPQLFILPAPNLRFVYWTVLAALLLPTVAPPSRISAGPPTQEGLERSD